MRIHPSLLAATAMLALAGCNDTSQAPDDAAGDATPSATDAAPSTTTPDQTPAPTPASTQGDTTDEMRQTIPAALQGKWGMVAADCTSTRGDAKGLLTIGSETLTFYEAVGTLQSVKQRDADNIVATFAFTGEGMEWVREESLSVSGSKLTRTATPAGGQAEGPYRYERCAS